MIEKNLQQLVEKARQEKRYNFFSTTFEVYAPASFVSLYNAIVSTISIYHRTILWLYSPEPVHPVQFLQLYQHQMISYTCSMMAAVFLK